LPLKHSKTASAAGRIRVKEIDVRLDGRWPVSLCGVDSVIAVIVFGLAALVRRVCG
jgi:hypothetical protein